MNKATFAIIGAGGIAKSQHLPNLSRAAHIHLKTVCDINKDAASAAQKLYDIPKMTTNHREVLSDPEVQAVVIATKEDAQAKLTIEALQAGKHVYVEKPLAVTTEECEAVVAAQEKSGLFAVVGFNRRMAPAYLEAKSVIDADGGPTNIHYRITDDFFFRDNGTKPPDFRMIHEVCHIFDILRWFTDSDVESVYCVEARRNDVIITLRFKSGCVASITDSGHATYDYPKERIDIIGDYGSVSVEEFTELRTFGYPDYDPVYRFEGHSHPGREYAPHYMLGLGGAEALYNIRRGLWKLSRQVHTDGPSGEVVADAELAYYKKHHYINMPAINYMVNKGWLEAVDHLAECILSGKTPQTACAEDGLKANQICHAALKSQNTGEVVRMADFT
jgi:predicted dehydrogenase